MRCNRHLVGARHAVPGLDFSASGRFLKRASLVLTVVSYGNRASRFLPTESESSIASLGTRIPVRVHFAGPAKIDLGMDMWTPLLPSTSSVMLRSAATLESM
jgi:hypothetical protein